MRNAVKTILLIGGMVFMCAVETHWIFLVLTVVCFMAAVYLDDENNINNQNKEV